MSPFGDVPCFRLSSGRQRTALLECRVPDLTDGAIASVAFTHGLTLVTANVADFTVFEGLVVFDWRTNKLVAR